MPSQRKKAELSLSRFAQRCIALDFLAASTLTLESLASPSEKLVLFGEVTITCYCQDRYVVTRLARCFEDVEKKIFRFSLLEIEERRRCLNRLAQLSSVAAKS